MQPNQVCSSNQIIWLESVDQAASFRWLSLIRANWRSLALSSLSLKQGLVNSKLST